MTNTPLRALLVCPLDHAPLRDIPDALICTHCHRRYAIIDGIPNMISEEATIDTEEE